MAPENKRRPARVVFVCVGNTCRSQMAEALARHHAGDVIEASSAGISPFGRIVDATRKVLVERGISLGNQHSKGLREAPVQSADLVVNMTGIPGRALFPKASVVDWDVGDPFGEDLGMYREICDEIEQLVKELAEDLRRSSLANAAPPRAG